MTMAWWNKNTVFTGVLGVVLLAIVLRLLPPFVPDVIQLTLVKNDAAIRTIDQPRQVAYQRTLWVDQLNFSDRNQLRHPKLGQIGYAEHFFIDIDHTFEVLQTGTYRFLIGSDDGFSARIDGNALCRFDRDRPYRKQTCAVQLEKGEHRFEMSYFQGGGFAGLTVEYLPQGADQAYFYGENSDWMRFKKKPPKNGG
ncbi:serine protease [Marinimicrobium sp. ARAG 43.8]|uniref:serine protease n=1 Tax=Marinimicrobium sp. ARAG 43.8 TaxID=3418719 RepID=UPI003CF32F1E